MSIEGREPIKDGKGFVGKQVLEAIADGGAPVRKTRAWSGTGKTTLLAALAERPSGERHGPRHRVRSEVLRERGK